MVLDIHQRKNTLFCCPSAEQDLGEIKMGGLYTPTVTENLKNLDWIPDRGTKRYSEVLEY